MSDEAMTPEECQRALDTLTHRIDGYAQLLVRTGCNLRRGQELVVQAPIECADFARRVVREAYAAGAKHVSVLWRDDALTRMEYENVAISFFEHVPEWRRVQLDSLAEDGAAFLFLDGSDPSALKGVDPAKPALARRALNSECIAYREGMDYGRNVWCIAGVPVAAWAKKVFPGVSAQEAVYRLWVAILEVARADNDDPQIAWETHNATFEKNKRLLNGAHFDSLRYESANGTNFVIGLNPGGIWEGGAGRTQDGTIFFPNMPTEEVFTSPDRMRADGIVYSALPLVHSGQIISDFWLQFENGRVVDYDAKKGRDVLQQIIETDENSCRLGECALISKNTPIRQTGLLFYDTLYDENASCHLALGMGFPECLEGGLKMSRDDLLAAGLNQSATHVDFMIGSDDLNIWGIRADGSEEPIFTSGQWTWECE